MNYTKSSMSNCIQKKVKSTIPFHIVIEGVDGAGKTTYTSKLRRELLKIDPSLHILTTSEPHSQTPYHSTNIDMIKWYAEDRIKWYEKGIPAHTDIIIQDRSFYSSYVNNVTNSEEKEVWKIENKNVPHADIILYLNYTSLNECVRRDSSSDKPHSLKELQTQKQRYKEILPVYTWFINKQNTESTVALAVHHEFLKEQIFNNKYKGVMSGLNKFMNKIQ